MWAGYPAHFLGVQQMAENTIGLDQAINMQVKEPGRFNVKLHENTSTPAAWVVGILTNIFGHTEESAKELSKLVDMEGVAVVGCYFYEIAEQKTTEAQILSRANGYNLDLKIEKVG